MRTRMKLALTALVAMAAVALLSLFFGWMNQPSDLWFWLGALGVLKIFVIAPVLVTLIWRPRWLREWAGRSGQGRTI